MPANEDEDDDDEEFDEEGGEEADESQDVSMNEDNEAESSEAKVAKEDEEPSPVAGPSHDPQPSTSKGETADTETEKEEDMTDAELAWQLLDMARNIYSSSEQSVDNIKMLAEALQKLGEISLEWENVENAIDLLNESLDLRKFNNIHPRIIAQNYHFLALATASKNEYDRSVGFMKDALALLEEYYENHQKLLADETDNVKKEMYKIEIADIESLLPEVQLQLEEYQAQEKTGYQSLSALEDEVDKNEKTNGRSSDVSDKPVNNISHLVKRKVCF